MNTGNSDGGFILDSNVPAAGGSSSSGSKAVYSASSAFLRRLTIPGNGIVVFKHKLSAVTFVGRVVEVKNMTSRLDIILKDPFGPPVLTQYWKQDEESPIDLSVIQKGSWLRVYGTAKKNINSQDVMIQAYHLTPVQGLPEVTGHFLESMLHNMVLNRMRMNLEQGVDASHCFPNSSQGHPFVNRENVKDDTQKHSSHSSSLSSDPSKVILKIIQDHSEEVNGVSFHQIKTHPSVRLIPEQVIREKIDHLSTEGHIYSTIDDNHFKSTD